MNRHERRRTAKLDRIKINVKDIQKGPIRHTTLPPMLIARIQRIQQVFKGIYDPDGLAGWIEGFQRDMHPENEVIIWEGYARAFTTFLASRPAASLAYRKEVFAFMMVMTNNDRDEIAAMLRGLRHMSLPDAKEFSDTFGKAWAEIKAETGYDAKHAQALQDYADLFEGERNG